jgi:hypothetical protein
MPKTKHPPIVIRATAGATVNAVVWIMSLTKPKERQSTQQVLTFLEPFLQAKQIPFLRFEPQTAADLFAFLTSLENRAKTGLRPIIHLDTHGGPGDGLYIAASGEFVTWQELAERLRPINVAAQNNICLVSAACFSLQTIMTLDFTAPTPFLIMLAPEHTVTFGFIESNMFNFYEDVLAFHDVLGAHERHLAPKLQQYHSHRLVLKSLSGYLRDGCTGKGRRKRVRRLMSEKLGPGKQHPDTPETRREARRVFRKATAPNQAIIDRYAKPFLLGQKLSTSFEEILTFVRTEAMRWNVLMQRAARSRRRNRRAQHARRKRSRALRRR